jgi:hypothetical protein
MTTPEQAQAAIEILTEHFLNADYPEALVKELERVVEDYYGVERDKYGCYTERTQS